MSARFALAFFGLLLLSVAPVRADDQRPDPAPHNELDEMVRELLPVVSRIRGLPWKRPVRAQMLSREKLREHLVRMISKDYPKHEQDRDNRIVHRLGLLREDQQIAPLVRGLLQEMVAGYYDPEAKKLFVIEGPVGDARKPTLVHELIHALDDQHFDLRAIEKPFDNDADRQFAIRCLWEGCAVHGQHLYGVLDPASAAAEMQQLFDDPSQSGGDSSSLKTLPTWLIVDSLLHYRAGPYLVGQLAKTDFPGTMQALFDDPPTTQEQFLHPERWMDPNRRDLPRTVHWAGPWANVGGGWTVVHDTPIGELNLALFFNHFLDDNDGKLSSAEVMSGRYVTDESHRAACGWDAGRSVVLERPGSPLVIIHAFAFDTLKDAEEADETLQRALQKRNEKVWKTKEQWQTRGDSTSARPTVYLDGKGMGAIVRRGREVLWIDGFAHALDWTAQTGARDWTPLLQHLLGTRFEQDPRDAGDRATGSEAGAVDPFAGCALVVRRRGIGIRTPSDEWQVRASTSNAPGMPVAVVSRKGALLQVLVIEQGLAKGALPILLNEQIPDFDATKLQDGRVAGWEGVHYPALRTPGRQSDVYAASDGIRTIIVMVMGQMQILRLYDDEIERIVSEIVSIPQY